jgi:dipeptidyl aminopeptidase/acylaminoacyl peptidase
MESFGMNNETRQGGYWGAVLDPWILNPKKIIVMGKREQNTMAFSIGVYEVDITTGKRSEVGGYTGDKNSMGLYFDNSGRIRIQTLDTYKNIEVRARFGDDMQFRPFMTFPRDALLSNLEHAEILADNQTLLFVDYSKHDRGAVVAWDLSTGKEVGEKFVPPEGEVTQLILGRTRQKLLGVRYEGDKEHTVWFDKELSDIQAALDRTFPETVNRITGWSDDRKKFIVWAASDVESGVYFIFDLTRAQPKLMPLGSARPELSSEGLAKMIPVHFKARDGLELQGYLTRPKGARGPGPLILNPHGGPYGVRDGWGYNDEVQFLANRGYSVLQVNYRGSGGLGRKLLEAGRLEWGRKMQDDLTDAVHWAIDQGIADPKQVAIYGASYGGYAALAGVVYTPDLYRCAINYVGAVDLTYRGRRDQGASVLFDEMFSEKWIHPDMEELKRRSPINYVEAIKVPVLNAYGENDPRVEWREWKKLKAEYDKHHVVYETYNQEDEGHGFANAPARVGFYLKMEDFLKRYMPVK